MLSLKNCRHLLGEESKKHTDAELTSLLDQLHCLGALMISLFQDVESREPQSSFKTALDLFAESTREENWRKQMARPLGLKALQELSSSPQRGRLTVAQQFTAGNVDAVIPVRETDG